MSNFHINVDRRTDGKSDAYIAPCYKQGELYSTAHWYWRLWSNSPTTYFTHIGWIAGLGGSVGCASDWRPGGRGFDPRRGQQHSFVEIEIFSTVILSLPLIQEGQLSVSGERMCTILVNHLEDKACPVNVWLGKLTALNMTPLGWLGHKTSTQTNWLNYFSHAEGVPKAIETM